MLLGSRLEVVIKNANENIDTRTSVNHTDLVEIVREAFIVLTDAMYQVCKVHHTDFRDMVEMEKENQQE